MTNERTPAGRPESRPRRDRRRRQGGQNAHGKAGASRGKGTTRGESRGRSVGHEESSSGPPSSRSNGRFPVSPLDRAASPAPRADGAGAELEPDGRIRLNRYLALNGIASRRAADRLIADGQVMVDDEIVTELGTRIDPTTQRVDVDGVVLKPEGERKRYYLLNKPANVVCTNDARENRRRAIDLIADRNKGRIYTVGRLDEETTGLVLLTNDGDFAYRLSHPRYGVPKVYEVVVQGRVEESQLGRLRGGVRLAEFRSSFEGVRVKKRGEYRTTLHVTLQGGRNREIRRVFARVGLPVRELSRIRIGDLEDRSLPVGYWRPLTRSEVRELLAWTEAKAGDHAPGRRRGGGAQRGPGGRSARASTGSRGGRQVSGDGRDSSSRRRGGQR